MVEYRWYIAIAATLAICAVEIVSLFPPPLSFSANHLFLIYTYKKGYSDLVVGYRPPHCTCKVYRYHLCVTRIL